MSKVAVLSNPDHAGDVSELRATRDAVGQRGLALQHFEVRTDDSFNRAFTAISQSGCSALLAFPDALTFFHRRAIADFAVRERLPSIFGWKPYVEAGGMMSYGPILRDNFVRLAVFVDKIFKGPSQLIYRSNSPRSLNWPSISRRRRRSGLRCHGFCSSAPTR